MEIKSLILGLMFSVGVFALKVGLGLQYYRSSHPARVGKIIVEIAWLLTYGLVFAVAALLVNHLNLGDHYELLMHIIRGGMMIHLAMFGLLVVWGLSLVKRTKPGAKPTRGWVALVFPCPVCLTVILFSVAFLAVYAPEHIYESVLLLFLVFAGLTLVGRLLFVSTGPNHSPEIRLGFAMIAIAAYFLLSVIVMPQFAELDNVYGLASYSGKQNQTDLGTSLITFGSIALIFLGGFGAMKIKIGRRI